jgi:hypothetical protein
MCIYLYIKTHKKTGLKYLGKTSSRNPHTYPGSGVYWRNHLDKHGYDYNTEILKECQSNQEVSEWGQYYSKLWKVVESNEWANLTEEKGAGGGVIWTEERRVNQSIRLKGRVSLNKGKTYEEIYGPKKAAEKVKKFRDTYKKKAETNPPKEFLKKIPHGKNRAGLTYEELFGKEKALQIKSKHRANMVGEKNPRYGKPGTFTGRSHSKETLEKMKKPRGPQKNPRKILVCPHCKKSTDTSNAKRWHFEKCKFKI